MSSNKDLCLAKFADPIQDIYKYNKDRGFLEMGYSDERECAYPIEEALEGFNTLETLSKLIYEDEMSVETSPKEISRKIIELVSDENVSGYGDLDNVDRLDKHLDTIVFAFGSIFKLGLNPSQAMEALSIVMEANLTKSLEKDALGKNIKGSSFIPPEEKLKKFFD